MIIRSLASGLSLLLLGGCAPTIELSHPSTRDDCPDQSPPAPRGDSAWLGEYDVSALLPLSNRAPSVETGLLVLDSIRGDSVIGHYQAHNRPAEYRKPALLRGHTLWIGCVLSIGCHVAGTDVYTVRQGGPAGFGGRWRREYGYVLPVDSHRRAIRAISAPFCARRR